MGHKGCKKSWYKNWRVVTKDQDQWQRLLMEARVHPGYGDHDDDCDNNQHFYPKHCTTYIPFGYFLLSVTIYITLNEYGA